MPSLSLVIVFSPKVWTPCDRRGEIGTAVQLDHHVWHQKCCHYKVGHFIPIFHTKIYDFQCSWVSHSQLSLLISTHRDFANFCLTSEVGKALRLWLQVLIDFKAWNVEIIQSFEKKISLLQYMIRTIDALKYKDVLVAVEHFWSTLAIVKVGQVQKIISLFFWNMNIFLVFQRSLLAPRMGRSVKTFQSWRSWTSSRWGRLFGGRSTKIIYNHIGKATTVPRVKCLCQSNC